MTLSQLSIKYCTMFRYQGIALTITTFQISDIKCLSLCICFYHPISILHLYHVTVQYIPVLNGRKYSYISILYSSTAPFKHTIKLEFRKIIPNEVYGVRRSKQ